jgi:hypothetical protein
VFPQGKLHCFLDLAFPSIFFNRACPTGRDGVQRFPIPGVRAATTHLSCYFDLHCPEAPYLRLITGRWRWDLHPCSLRIRSHLPGCSSDEFHGPVAVPGAQEFFEHVEGIHVFDVGHRPFMYHVPLATRHWAGVTFRV